MQFLTYFRLLKNSVHNLLTTLTCLQPLHYTLPIYYPAQTVQTEVSCPWPAMSEMKITVRKHTKCFIATTVSYLSPLEYALALGIEEIIAPQSLVKHVSTDTKFLGV